MPTVVGKQMETTWALDTQQHGRKSCSNFNISATFWRMLRKVRLIYIQQKHQPLVGTLGLSESAMDTPEESQA